MIYSIDTRESFNDLLSCLQNGASLKPIDNGLFKFNNNEVLEFTDEYKSELELHDIINGINKESNIVNISVNKNDGYVYIFKEKDGTVSFEKKEFKHWALSKEPFNSKFKTLIGAQPYKYYREYSLDEYLEQRKNIYKYGMYTVHNHTENFMIKNGFTYFKDMRSQDVSLLSFDIETTGFNPQAEDALVLLITNTFRKQGKLIQKTFVINDYESEAALLNAWCKWVQEINPTLLIGHNIVMFDLPYLYTRAQINETDLFLGRDGSAIEIESINRELRKDGSQTYTYNRVNCFGRDIVDTFFLAIKADIARKYESYGLKALIKAEGLEKPGRQHYDAADIQDNWDIPEERTKIIKYAEDDSEDPIKLFDLMIPSFFYLTPFIPKPFQIMIESATGSQINALMVRSYLQKGMSIAEGSSAVEFEGAISFGNPGIYDNVFKVDIASLYPNIMSHYKVYPKEKDFNSHFLKMLNYFTSFRLKNKKLAKETGDRYYDDLQNAVKVVINSAYGFMGSERLNYNYPDGAAEVTKYGRELITKAIEWAKVKGYTISNCDTDSISFTTGKVLSKEEQQLILDDLNVNYPNAIRFENDGFFNRVVILKAKNYILYDGEKIKLKGSSLKDSKREPATKEMLSNMIHCLIHGHQEDMVNIYNNYIKEALNVKDVYRWATKKTITKAILNCAKDPDARLNERKVYEAVKNSVSLQEGDKVYLYPCILKQEIIKTEYKNGNIKEKVKKEVGLKLASNWNNDEDKDKLVERIVDTVQIFSNVYNTETFIDYTLVKNKKLLDNIK